MFTSQSMEIFNEHYSRKIQRSKVTAPDETITRPTLSKVRMAVFNTLQALIDFEGASF